MKFSYLPPLMVYAAYGVSGLTAIVGTFFVKEYLVELSPEFLAALLFWAGIPWALKMPVGHLVDLIWRWKALLVWLGAGMVAVSLLIMIGRQRLALVDVERRMQLLCAQRVDEVGFDHDRPARGIHQHRAGLHQREVFGAHQAARALAEDEMDGDDIAVREQFFPGDARHAGGQRLLVRQVLAPGDAFHAERLADRRHARADVAEPQQAEGFSGQ